MKYLDCIEENTVVTRSFKFICLSTDAVSVHDVADKLFVLTYLLHLLHN